MAATLCKIIPFPKVIILQSDEDYNAAFAKVLMACKSFSNLEIPVELYADTCSWRKVHWSDVTDYLESCPQLTMVSIAFVVLSCGSPSVGRLCKWLFGNKSLSEFTLKFTGTALGMAFQMVQICDVLALCRTLSKVKFSLPGYTYSEGFFNAFETGLATLTSVGLELRGSMKYTATRAVQKFLSKKSLRSLSLCIVGVDVQDFLVAAVSEALAGHEVLKSLDLHFGGPLSFSSANILEKGLMENSSLNYLRLCVYGELPGNWHSVVENLRSAKKPSFVCSIYPNTWNNVADNFYLPVVIRNGPNLMQHITVHV